MTNQMARTIEKIRGYGILVGTALEEVVEAQICSNGEVGVIRGKFVLEGTYPTWSELVHALYKEAEKNYQEVAVKQIF